MKSIVVANWKMYPTTFREAKSLFDATKKVLDGSKSVSLVVAPPSLFLRDLSRLYKGRRIRFALQNAHPDASGANTGEISLAQGKDAHATHCIIGHAERREMGETNDDARRKVASALALKMTPILCVGEVTRSASGEHYQYIKDQLRIALMDVSAQKISHIIVAYEPVWAIGASHAMSPRDMHEMAIFIRKSIVETHGKEGMQVTILYGGSVDETNAAAMLSGGDVSGFLVGRASVDATKFSELMKSLSKK